jgi:hypothetical protein
MGQEGLLAYLPLVCPRLGGPRSHGAENGFFGVGVVVVIIVVVIIIIIIIIIIIVVVAAACMHVSL